MSFELFTKNGVRDMYAYRHEPERMRAFADFYWRALLVAATVVALAVIAFGIWELSAVLGSRSPSGEAAPGVQSIPKLDTVKLKNTLSGFQTRRERFESLKTVPPKIADPSL